MKIVLLDSHSVCNEMIRTLLHTECMEVVRDFRYWIDLFIYLEKITPDLILLNLSNGYNYNLESLRKLKQLHPDIPVVVITSEEHPEIFIDYLLIGINGLILKSSTAAELGKAIREVIKGEDYYPNLMFRKLKEYLVLYHINPAVMRQRHVLSRRETEILRLFCKGMTFKQISRQLFISPRTVETHKRNIMSKLNIKTTAEMIQLAVRQQMV